MKIAVGISNPASGRQRLVLAFNQKVAQQLVDSFGVDTFRIATLTPGYAELEPATGGLPGTSRISKQDTKGGCRLAFDVESGTPDFSLNSRNAQQAVINCGKLVVEFPSPKDRRPAAQRTRRPKGVSLTSAAEPETVMFLTEHDAFDVPPDMSKAIHRMLTPYKRKEPTHGR